jgi:glycosyltransferase involved in cell wall biosynthesis
LPNTSTNESVRQKYQLPEKYFLFLGTIEPRKNITAIITAFDFITPSLPAAYSLVIAGAPGWKNEQVVTAITASPYRNRILFLGHVPLEDKKGLYEMAEIFIYPSFYEGFGFPVLEAMASRTPVITSNRSSLPEITEGAAYMINPYRPEEIADGLQRLTSDQALRQKYIANGLVQSQKFNWKNAAATWLKALT